MKRFVRDCLVASLIMLFPAAGQAQSRTPAADSAAIGGDAGLLLPKADDLKAGLDIFGFYEYYPAPRTRAVKAEGRYHLVSDANGFDPDGLSLTVGLKKYF